MLEYCFQSNWMLGALWTGCQSIVAQHNDTHDKQPCTHFPLTNVLVFLLNFKV